MNNLTGFIFAGVLLALHCWASDQQAQQLFASAGVKGGLVVHVGCGDGKLTAALRANDAFLVHGLDADTANVAAARKHIQSLGLYGPVSVEPWSGGVLPYADNLVNLLVAEKPGLVSMDEVMRVLAPNGVAIIAGKKTVKPWPKEIDEWTHYLHGPDNNAVAHDRVVASPQRLQWQDKPLWNRSHEYHSSLVAMVSAQGRLFCIFDEGPTGVVDPRIPDKWKLIGRDAFNGIVLWKRDIADWGWRAWNPKLESVDWRRMPSQRAALPAAIARRLVAAGDRVYVTLGYQAPVTALDAATGKTIMTYAGTEKTDEILYRDGRLVLCVDGTLMAFDAATGRRLWETTPSTVTPLSLACTGDNVFFHEQSGVVCLDAASGKRRWRATMDRVATLVVHDKVVLCANAKHLVAFSVADGKLLWTLPGAKGFGAINPPDLFVAGGLVWYGNGRPEVETITGYDPLTGTPARTVNMGWVITRGHHPRCYRSKATDDYLLLPKRGVEFISLAGQPHTRNNWVRGACRYGVLPCNGLLYSTPHPCFCYAGVKLGGFLALAPGKTGGEGPAQSGDRLECGPAYASRSTLHAASDWPMYRHDPKRSGSTTTTVSTEVGLVWKTHLGGRLTQPVAAGGQLFVARVDAGQVCCLDAATGQPVWDFISGGRIDSAPTYYKGFLMFGSADGSVYCLRASDGALAWRFRAAPAERRIVVEGRVESPWPVHGSVLILNDTAYFTAGRSSFLDGGIFVYGLDPLSGEKRCETRLAGPEPDTKTPDENAYAMEGAKSDLLVSDGALLYLFHNAFNARLEKQAVPVLGEPGVRNLGERKFGEHLFANAGFLDDSWFSRNHWMLGDHWTAFNFAHQAPKAGELLVFDETRTYAVKAFVRRNMLSPLFFPATDGYFVVADANSTRPVLVNPRQQSNWLRWLPQDGEIQRCWNLDVGFARGEPPLWKTVVPVRIRAMVRTANALFAAGPPDLCDPDALEGRAGAILLAFNPDDGKKVFECNLDAAPIFDGMMAANNRLYLAATDGHVLCFAGK